MVFDSPFEDGIGVDNLHRDMLVVVSTNRTFCVAPRTDILCVSGAVLLFG